MSRTKHRRRWIPSALAAVTALSSIATATPAVADEEKRERVRIEYQRERAEQEREARPAAPAVPEDLRSLAADDSDPAEAGTDRDVEASTAAPRETRAHRAPGEGAPADDRVAERARRAARESAVDAIRGGRIAYYRVGAWEGLRAALDDPAIGARDFRAGLRRGLRDPLALRLGTDEGALVSDELALREADDQVAAQFRDLTREPRPRPRFSPPAWDVPAGWADPPLLEDVFRDFPVSRRFSPRLAEAFHDWRHDPWNLYRRGSHREFHDRQWADAGRALAGWKRDRRNAAEYRALSAAERERFDRAFRVEFRRSLAARFEREILRAFDFGFEDGWDYGAFLHEEWRYRQGYTEGFDRAAASAAEATFRASWPAAFERAYDRAFADWRDNPRPEIVSLRLVDENDDGVFEPGEELSAYYEIANYGGRGASFRLALAGNVLEPREPRTLDLPARELLRDAAPLRARIDPRTPARTRTQVALRLGELDRPAGLLVSYPLEFAGPVTLDGVDALAGRATLAARVVNQSRRALTGVVDAAGGDGYRTVAPAETGPLPAGAARDVVLRLEGLRPLDVLAGTLGLELELTGGGRLQDRQSFRMPPLGLDLQRRDLLELMLALGRERRPRADEVRGARALLIERLRADWNAAVRSRGNPYKRDLKGKTAGATALGDLVATYRRERRTLASPEVFAGLEGEVVALSRELPGAHPFLRKAMRKLARKLD